MRQFLWLNFCVLFRHDCIYLLLWSTVTCTSSGMRCLGNSGMAACPRMSVELVLPLIVNNRRKFSQNIWHSSSLYRIAAPSISTCPHTFDCHGQTLNPKVRSAFMVYPYWFKIFPEDNFVAMFMCQIMFAKMKLSWTWWGSFMIQWKFWLTSSKHALFNNFESLLM